VHSKAEEMASLI